jgi:hypothetical protein
MTKMTKKWLFPNDAVRNVQVEDYSEMEMNPLQIESGDELK